MMTPEEEKQVQEFWRRKVRDASGKLVRPCDAAPLTDEEGKELEHLSLGQRRIAGQLKMAQRQTVEQQPR